MNINTNYQIKSFNSSANHHTLHKNPSFGKKQYIAPTTKVLTAAVSSAIAAAVLTRSDIEKTKENEAKMEKVPTRKEFIAILENDNIHKKYIDVWLELYKQNPAKALELYNMEDKDGNRYFENNSIPLCFCFEPTIIENPDFVKEVAEVENDIGVPYFQFSKAASIVVAGENHEDGVRTMLNLKDENDNLRFIAPADYSIADIFEQYPVSAIEYALAKDFDGTYRFSSDAICKIIKTKEEGKYPIDKIDEFMELKRPDGSYVHYKFEPEQFEAYMKNPKEYQELCNLIIPKRDKYISSEYIFHLLEPYQEYPIETKKILQMPSIYLSSDGSIRDTRFDAYQMQDEKGLESARIFSKAPISYTRLAYMTDSKDRSKLLFYNLDDINNVITSLGTDKDTLEIKELTKEQLKMVYDLAILARPHQLSVEGIIKAAKTFF